MCVREPLPLRAERAEQAVELCRLLQLAQVLGVRRGDVHRYIARAGVHLPQALNVVVGGAVERRVEILAYIDSEHPAKVRTAHVVDQAVDAVVVETHAIDDSLCRVKPEQTRAGIARLRPRCDRADFDEPKPERGERVDALAVLVEARCEPHGIGKVETHHAARTSRRLNRNWQQAGVPQSVQRRERDRVRSFGVERKQQRAQKPVRHGAILIALVHLRRHARSPQRERRVESGMSRAQPDAPDAPLARYASPRDGTDYRTLRCDRLTGTSPLTVVRRPMPKYSNPSSRTAAGSN